MKQMKGLIIFLLFCFMLYPVHTIQAASVSFFYETKQLADSDNGLGNISISGDKNGNIKITDNDSKTPVKDSSNYIFKKTKMFSAGITGLLSLICFGCFIFSISQFTGSSLSGQPGKKWMAVAKLLTAGISAILLGGYSVYTIYIYQLLR
jgi:hypothetical protein